MAEQSESGRLAPLDALRGFAALAVAVISHYQHFGGDKKTYPLRDITPVAWLYDNSWLFVDLFFLVSGVVFTYRYFEPIASKRLSGRDFLSLRLSRLYPLHVAALLVCAAVQWSLLARHQPQVIYEHSDVYHFALQLFYLHTWFEHGWSYNEPTWSVCGEVFVYALFFLFASRYAKSFTIACAVALFIGIAGQSNMQLPLMNELMARSLAGFFAGSLLFQVTQRIDREGYGTLFGVLALFALAVLGALAWKIGYAAFVGTTPLPHALVVFPLVIAVSLKVPPLAKVLSARPFTFLGDISYAVYLVHVPLQMVVLAVTRARSIVIPTENARIFYAYLAAVVLLATAVHYGLERPARRWLRRRLLRVAPARAAGAQVSVEATVS